MSAHPQMESDSSRKCHDYSDTLLDLPGSKVVVGDGPARKKLQTRFPGAHFVGEMRDERLAAAYASADLGLVLLEALASGLSVAANPVVGPLDVIGDSALAYWTPISVELRSQLSQFPESSHVPVHLPSAPASPRDNLSTTCLPPIDAQLEGYGGVAETTDAEGRWCTGRVVTRL
jgi:hypothetical protein